MALDPQNDWCCGDLQYNILRKILDRLQFVSGGGGGGGGGTLSTDITLGGGSPSDLLYPSQRAVKFYVDAGLALKENLSNKSNDVLLSADSATLYPTQHAVKAYVDANSGGAPGGLNTYIQFNDSGSFGGDADFTFDKVTGIFSTAGGAFTVDASGNTSVNSGQIYLSTTGQIDWAGASGSLTSTGDIDTIGGASLGSGLITLNANGSASLATGAVAIDALGNINIGAGQIVLNVNGQIDWASASGALTSSGDISTIGGLSLGSGAFAIDTSGLVATVLAFTGTTNPGLRLNNLTTAQRDAIAPGAGTLIYNTTTGRVNFFDTAWRNGWVSIAGDTMTGLLQFSGTTNPGIRLNNLTTAQRDALAAAAGEVVWNTTTSTVDQYNGAAWSSLASGGPFLPLTGGTLSGGLSFSGTTNPGLRVNNLTTAQRDALAASAGTIIWNTTTSRTERFDGTSWSPVGVGTASNAVFNYQQFR